MKQSVFFSWGDLDLVAIPALKDNYIWGVVAKKRVLLIDPSQADVVKHFLDTYDFCLERVLITHRHADHVGGVDELINSFPSLCVSVGQKTLSSLGRSWLNMDILEPDTQVSWSGASLVIKVLDLSGHTSDQIGFVMTQSKVDGGQPPSVLFCGDALFSLGCGRVFDGTYEQSFDTLTRIAELPEETWVCCAHEYTFNNLDFALSLEPNSVDLLRLKQTLLAESMSLPSTLSFELAFNPFLRAVKGQGRDISLRRSLEGQFGTDFSSCSPLDLFTRLRVLKDRF